jgi:hypothetical protein
MKHIGKITRLEKKVSDLRLYISFYWHLELIEAETKRNQVPLSKKHVYDDFIKNHIKSNYEKEKLANKKTERAIRKTLNRIETLKKL